MATLDDIFAVQKNGVIAINNLSTYMSQIAAKYVGTTLANTSLTTSYATLYTAPDGTRSYITEIDITNTTSSPILVSVNITPPTTTGPGAAATTDALFNNISIPGNTVMQWTGAILFTYNYTIQAQASASGCNIFITGGSVA